MKNALNQSLEQMLATARNKRLRRRVLAFLSAFVLLLTVNGTKFTADTLERIEGCGLAEHAHAAECYDADGNLTCGLVEHVHTDACYQTRPVKQTADEGEPEYLSFAVSAAPNAPIIPDISGQITSVSAVFSNALSTALFRNVPP